MKSKLISLIASVTIACSSLAQTNSAVSPFTLTDTNAPAITNILGPQVGKVLDFFSTTATNWSFIPFVTLIEDKQRDSVGGGIAATYSLSDYAGAMLRLDYLDGEVFMPSGNFQLQLPITLGGKFQVVPFALTGIATPFNDESGEDVIGIVGAGVGLRVSSRIGLVYGAEKWTGFDGIQHRIGVLFRF